MKINFYIILLYSLFIFIGCGAYFNTYYNAEKAFEDAEVLIDKSKKTEESDIPQQAKKLLTQSIDKSQKVIENHPESRWIDDSYFLIAKASFIKGDYQYADKFFRKLIKEYPNSSLWLESNLWLSYTMLKNNMIDSSLFYINSLSKKELKDNHKYLKYTILAEIDLLNHKYREAFDNFEKTIDYINSDSKKSSIYERLVKISEENDDKEKTIYFLDKLNSFAQTNELKHESKLKWLKYNRELGNLDIVRIEIDKLLARSDYEQIYLSLELEKVKILLYEDKLDLAKENLLYITANNTKKKETAEAHYLLGLHYLTNEWDLDKAKEYFSNVKIEYSRSIYLDNSIDLKNTIDKYQGLEKIFTSQQAGDTSIVEFTIDEEEKVDTPIDLGLNLGGFNPGISGYSNPNLNMPDFEEENLSSVVIKGTIDSLIFAMGEILYFDFQQLDSAESKFEYLYENHPESKFTPQAMYILSNTVEDSILWKNKLIEEYTENNFSKAIQGIEIELNTIDLLDNKSDSLWFSVDTYPDSIAKEFVNLSELYNNSKALYSAAYVYDYYLNDINNSQLYYQVLLDSFPDSEFNSKANSRLGIIQNAIKDTIVIIDTLNINKDSLDMLISINDTNDIDDFVQFPPLPIPTFIDSSSNDLIQSKLIDEKISDRIDTLKVEYIQPLKDVVIKDNYEIQDIVHWTDHIIKRGESLEKISLKYYENISMVDSLVSWNKNIFKSNKNLIYPYTVIKVKTDRLINKSSIYNDYIIVSGETLWSISKELLDDPYAWLLIYNDNKNILVDGANSLKPGMKIKIREY